MYKKLESLLVEKGISKKGLADELSIGYNTLLLKMHGKYNFTLDEALKIKKILKTNLSLEEIFKKIKLEIDNENIGKDVV